MAPLNGLSWPAAGGAGCTDNRGRAGQPPAPDGRCSWTIQPVPSGSLNDRNELKSARAGSGPGRCWPSSKWKTSLTFTPPPGEFVPRGLDVGHDELQAIERAGRILVSHESDRACRTGRGQLHDPEVLACAVIDVQVKTGLIHVEGLGAVHVRHGNHDELKLPVHGISPSLVRGKTGGGLPTSISLGRPGPGPGSGLVTLSNGRAGRLPPPLTGRYPARAGHVAGLPTYRDVSLANGKRSPDSPGEQQPRSAANVSESRPAAVIILAAGAGTRMESDLPKVLHTICGRSMLDHVVAAARELDPAELIVVVGHCREQVTSHLAEHAPGVRAVVQHRQGGTGHAVRTVVEEEVRHVEMTIDDGPGERDIENLLHARRAPPEVDPLAWAQWILLVEITKLRRAGFIEPVLHSR